MYVFFKPVFQTASDSKIVRSSKKTYSKLSERMTHKKSGQKCRTITNRIVRSRSNVRSTHQIWTVFE